MIPAAIQIFAWSFKDGSYDWRYPNSVDMTLYKKETIIKALHQLHYTNPSNLEGNWFIPEFVDYEKVGLCYQSSKIINIPLNVVQTERNNAHMYIETEYLLDLFNKGFKIDYNPFLCHYKSICACRISSIIYKEIDVSMTINKLFFLFFMMHSMSAITINLVPLSGGENPNSFFNVHARDNCMKALCDLRDALDTLGYEFKVVSMEQACNELVQTIVFDTIPYTSEFNHDVAKWILFLWEPPTVLSHTYYRILHQAFGRVFTMFDGLVDGKNIINSIIRNLRYL